MPEPIRTIGQRHNDLARALLRDNRAIRQELLEAVYTLKEAQNQIQELQATAVQLRGSIANEEAGFEALGGACTALETTISEADRALS